jgi:hypothetical protein
MELCLDEATRFSVVGRRSFIFQVPEAEVAIPEDEASDFLAQAVEEMLTESQQSVTNTWLQQYEKLPPQGHPEPILSLHPAGIGRKALETLRRRGLGDEIIAEMEKFFTGEEMKIYLFELRRGVKPKPLRRRD